MNQNSSKFKHRIAGFTILTTILISANASAGWSIYGLGTLLGDTNSSASDINNSGQVVGYSLTPGITGTHAFITGPNGIGMTALGTLGGGYSVATGINDSGQVTGHSSLSNNNLRHSFITGINGIGMTDLGAFTGYFHEMTGEYIEISQANDINESGQVVGFNGAYYFTSERAYMTGPNGVGVTILDIPFPGAQKIAEAINDSGQVVGAVGEGAFTRAFVTGPNGSGATILEGLDKGESLGTGPSRAASINNSGQVVGQYTFISPDDVWAVHAFVTGPNGIGITDLGTLGGSNSVAVDINESGQIIGYSNFSDDINNNHAFLYSDGEMIDLSLLPAVLNAGWTQLYAAAINDHGQIVGSGMLNGNRQAFLLSPFPIPVPESQTYAMLLAGLGLLGFMVQRRKKRNLI